MKRSATFDFTFSGRGSKKKKGRWKRTRNDRFDGETDQCKRASLPRGVAEEVAVANEGRVWWGEEKTPPATSLKKCHILKPEDSSPKRDSNPHNSIGGRLGKQTFQPLHQASTHPPTHPPSPSPSPQKKERKKTNNKNKKRLADSVKRSQT